MPVRPHLSFAALAGLSPLVIASAASFSYAGDVCPSSDHTCFRTGDPGCSDADCCNLVCGQDPFCCEASWDNSCVNTAFALCGAPPCDFVCPPGASDEGEPCGQDTNGGCNLPVLGDSNCCAPHGSPGCADFDCELAVCSVEPFCCEFDWDGFCAGLSLQVCPDLCSLGPPAFTPISCGETICATSWASNNVQDTDWYQATFDTTTLVTFSATSTLALRFGIIDNDGVPDCGISTALSPIAFTQFCGSASITACLVPGTYWFYVAPTNFDGFPCDSGFNNYYVTLTCSGSCVPPSCGASSTGDCFVATGSPYCNDESCCNSVCVINPFCCDVAWDDTCVGEANFYCVFCDLTCPPGAVAELEACGEDTNGGCNLPVLGDSSCCIPNGGLGCDDLACQEAVCGFDAFCCEVVWDSVCAGYTQFFCADLCPLGPPAFEPISCGMTICGTAWAEGGVHDTDWYEITVTEITPITFSGTAQFPLVLGVSDTGGFPDCNPSTAYQSLNPYVLANPCTQATLSTCLEPGTWYLYVAPQLTEGWPCGAADCDCPDLNHDGTVNATDLGILLGAWGSTDPCANLDGTGTVGAADLGILLGAWGPYTCPASTGNSYTVSLTCGGACTGPANDFCQTATPISLGSTAFSSVGATSGGPLLPASCDEGFDLLMVKDIWYVYTPTETGILTVSTCSQASFDTRLAAYAGPCSNLTIVGCNDDSAECSPPFTSNMAFLVFEGQQYHIRLGSYADSGEGTLTLTFE